MQLTHLTRPGVFTVGNRMLVVDAIVVDSIIVDDIAIIILQIVAVVVDNLIELFAIGDDDLMLNRCRRILEYSIGDSIILPHIIGLCLFYCRYRD